MDSLVIAGISLPFTPLLVLAAWLMLAGLNRLQSAPVAGFSDALLHRLLISLLGARLLFVLQQWPAYQADWLSMLDIRDRGVDAHGFLLLFSLLLLHYIWQDQAARRLLRWALPVVLLASGALFALYRQFYPAMQAQSWPALAFQTLQAEPVQLSVFAVNPPDFTVVNLWASWCPPCRAEMPMLLQMQQAYPNGRIVLLNQGESAEEVNAFFRQQQLQATWVWLDSSASMGRWVGQSALPLTLFFNQQGQLVDGHAGLLSRAMFEKKISSLLQHQQTPQAR